MLWPRLAPCLLVHCSDEPEGKDKSEADSYDELPVAFPEGLEGPEDQVLGELHVAGDGVEPSCEGQADEPHGDRK